MNKYLKEKARIIGKTFTTMKVYKKHNLKIRLPVRMFWNADSTLVESSADVSMNERLFRSLKQTKIINKLIFEQIRK